MGSSEFEDWAEFYRTEPWGAYRDNLHAAIIARAIDLGKTLKPGAQLPTIDDYILRTPEERKSEELAKGVNWLRSMATKPRDIDK